MDERRPDQVGTVLSAQDTPVTTPVSTPVSSVAPRPEPGSLADLQHRALLATDMAFTVTDSRTHDNPLVWVNPAFTRVTGYSSAEVLGRNCRFLQGEDTDPESVAMVGRAIRAGEAATVTMLNYRRDGSPFWNELTISPVLDDGGDISSYVGVQSDVSVRIGLDVERTAALVAERLARADTDRARAHLALLVDATTQLSSTLDVSEAMARLATIAVPRMADWVIINLVDRRGNLSEVTTRHRDGHSDLLARLAALQPEALSDRSGVGRLLGGDEPFVLAGASIDSVRGHVTEREILEVTGRLGCRSVMYVPLLTRRHRLVGTMTLVSGPSGRQFTDEDLEAAADLGRRAGLTLDNAQLYEQEHRAAGTLQRSLLPELPVVERITTAARYLPGEATADVGGDFYDVLPLPDGSIGLAIGDVVGHDLAAAAAMSNLRGMLRACAWDATAGASCGDPGRVLDCVDRLVRDFDVAPLATLFYARLVLGHAPGADARLTYANAGHPAPLIRRPGGEVQRLAGGAGLLLGVADLGRHPTAGLRVSPGSVLVAYTDGLVERRGVDLEESMAWLEQKVADLPVGIDPERILDSILGDLSGDRDDDLAVLSVRVDD